MRFRVLTLLGVALIAMGIWAIAAPPAVAADGVRVQPVAFPFAYRGYQPYYYSYGYPYYNYYGYSTPYYSYSPGYYGYYGYRPYYGYYPYGYSYGYAPYGWYRGGPPGARFGAVVPEMIR